jgi:GGDEF domain-containing protein
VIYSHDGLRDSLTQLAAPTLFYEELRRELARGQREHYPISLVRFVLVLSNRVSGKTVVAQSSNFESEILRFAHLLTRLSRGEDVCARMGELEFVCLIRGVDEATQSFISRIMITGRAENLLESPRQHIGRTRLAVSSLSSQEGERALDIMARLDRVPPINFDVEMYVK